MINKSKYFDDDIKVLLASKKSFSVERSGSFTYVNFDGKRLQYGPENHGGVAGAHLSKLVRKDVEQLVVYKQSDPYYGEDPTSVYASPQNLNASIGEYVLQIDIRNCYWKTAYEQGIITKKTYLMGLRKKEWKVGRNAAIGSLDKKKVVTWYEKGKEVDSERYVMHRNYRYARQKVLHRVDKIAKDVINNVCVGGEFLMFITDCFFIKKSAAQKVRDYLAENGYDYSEATVFLTYHFPQKKMVVWDKIESGTAVAGKKTLKRERDKFIHYTNKAMV